MNTDDLRIADDEGKKFVLHPAEGRALADLVDAVRATHPEGLAQVLDEHATDDPVFAHRWIERRDNQLAVAAALAKVDEA